MREIDAWIGFEALGDATWLRAEALVRDLSPELRKRASGTAVVLRLPDAPLWMDDFATLRILRRFVPELRIVALVDSEESHGDGDLARQLDELNVPASALAGDGAALPAPKSLDLGADPAQTTARLMAWLRSQTNRTETAHRWARQAEAATGLTLGRWQRLLAAPGPTNGVEALTSGLWRFVQLGATQYGLWLAERLYRMRQPPMVEGHLLVTLQLMRLVCHQYSRAAREEHPVWLRFADARLRRLLHYLKAYCASMAGKLETARRSFAAAAIDEHLPAEDAEALFRLNSFALYKFRSGERDLAARIEERIAATILRKRIAATGIRYVNAINRARLARVSERYDEARVRYDEAYAVIAGTMSPSDYLYRELNRGRVLTAAGRHREGFLAYLRAAMYWLAMTTPEGLAWRPALLLDDGRASRADQAPDISQSSRRLLQLLQASAAKCGYTRHGAEVGRPADICFRLLTADRCLRAARAVGTPALGVLVSETDDDCSGARSVVEEETASASRLKDAVVAYLRWRLPQALGGRWQTCWVDASSEDMPSTAEELCALALRCDASEASFGERSWTRADLHSDSFAERIELYRAAGVEAAVQLSTHTRFEFKRLRAPVTRPNESLAWVGDWYVSGRGVTLHALRRQRSAPTWPELCEASRQRWLELRVRKAAAGD